MDYLDISSISRLLFRCWTFRADNATAITNEKKLHQ
uniref:Uncharacterized protein n=1 Tax=Anguilla anguilla TaxID=7936 RepID=A0A0E9V0J7_ANGAN